MGNAIIKFDWELIKSILATGKKYGDKEISQGIPPDAQIQNISHDFWPTGHDVIEIVIISEELPEVTDDELPNHDIIITQKG